MGYRVRGERLPGGAVWPLRPATTAATSGHRHRRRSARVRPAAARILTLPRSPGKAAAEQPGYVDEIAAVSARWLIGDFPDASISCFDLDSSASIGVTDGPQIDPVDITPFRIGNPSARLTKTFGSLDFDNTTAARIPQDLSIVPDITRGMLEDPNTLLRNQIKGHSIVSTDVIQIGTKSPIPGGGVVNIGFLMGDSTGPNAQAVEMSATFWVETVQTHIQVDPMSAGNSRVVSPKVPARAPAPTFLVTSKVATNGRSVPVTYTQIQYTQNVSLNLHCLTWPHVSVATLVPLAPIPVDL
jgi:hypothetical protein